MGVAAYNRSSQAIREHINQDDRPREFEIIELAKALAKYPDAGTPFEPINFVFSHGGCWAECPRTGFGYWYPTIYEAVRRWNVTLTGFCNGIFESRLTRKKAHPAGGY